jgi:hypothetical protein
VRGSVVYERIWREVRGGAGHCEGNSFAGVRVWDVLILWELRLLLIRRRAPEEGLSRVGEGEASDGEGVA